MALHGPAWPALKETMCLNLLEDFHAAELCPNIIPALVSFRFRLHQDDGRPSLCAWGTNRVAFANNINPKLPLIPALTLTLTLSLHSNQVDDPVFPCSPAHCNGPR